MTVIGKKKNNDCNCQLCLFCLSERDRNFSFILSYELQFAYQKFFLLATCCNDLCYYTLSVV